MTLHQPPLPALRVTPALSLGPRLFRPVSGSQESRFTRVPARRNRGSPESLFA